MNRQSKIWISTLKSLFQTILIYCDYYPKFHEKFSDLKVVKKKFIKLYYEWYRQQLKNQINFKLNIGTFKNFFFLYGAKRTHVIAVLKNTKRVNHNFFYRKCKDMTKIPWPLFSTHKISPFSEIITSYQLFPRKCSK